MQLNELIVYNPSKVSPRFKDKTGWENEYFKVISRAPNTPSGRTRWNCLCKSCGKYCVKETTNLTKHKSCGCTRNQKIGQALRKDLTGKRFGKLIAIQYAGYSNKSGNAIWKCKCDCGNFCNVDSNNLISNHTTSCGCIHTSIGEDNIRKILFINNIKFQQEYRITGLYNKHPDHPFRLDFVLFDKEDNIFRAVEYDGIQHYRETWGKWKTNRSLQQQQQADKQKNQWCKQHNIPLVRILYTERDNITLDLILGDKYLI